MDDINRVNITMNKKTTYIPHMQERHEFSEILRRYEQLQRSSDDASRRCRFADDENKCERDIATSVLRTRSEILDELISVCFPH